MYLNSYTLSWSQKCQNLYNLILKEFLLIHLSIMSIKILWLMEGGKYGIINLSRWTGDWVKKYLLKVSVNLLCSDSTFASGVTENYFKL